MAWRLGDYAHRTMRGTAALKRVLQWIGSFYPQASKESASEGLSSMAEADEPSTGADDEFATNVLQSMQDIFWQPEIDRRGGLEVTGTITKALAILAPGSATEVKFNKEFELAVQARVNRPIEAGEDVTIGDVDDVEWLEPVGIDPDAGWAAFVVLPDGRAFVSFDFRRNLNRGRRLLALAREYFDTSAHALEMGHAGPCLDACHTAIELAVTAMMYTSDDTPLAGGRDRHGRRLHWLNSFTKLGNAPRNYHEALVELSRLRSAARYGDPELSVSRERIEELHATAARVIEHAETRLGSVRDRDPEPSVTTGGSVRDDPK